MALFKRHEGKNAPNLTGIEYERPRKLVDARWLAKQDDLDECWYDIEGRLGWKSGNFGHAFTINGKNFQPSNLREAQELWQRLTQYLWALRNKQLHAAMNAGERADWNRRYQDERGQPVKDRATGLKNRSLDTDADEEIAAARSADPRMDFTI